MTELNHYQLGMLEAETYRDDILSLIEAARASDDGIYNNLWMRLHHDTRPFTALLHEYTSKTLPRTPAAFMEAYARVYAQQARTDILLRELEQQYYQSFPDRQFAKADTLAPFGPYAGTTMNDIMGA